MTSLTDLNRAIEEVGSVPCENAPDFFFDAEEDHRPYMAARKLCAGCPIQNVCLSYALDNHEPFGMWGGLSPRERKELLRRAC